MQRRTTDSYLERRRARTALAEMKRHAAFGVALSTILLAIGAWNYFFVVGANDAAWLAVIAIGLLTMLAALLLPAACFWPERAASKVTQKIGRVLFAGFLSALYFAVVTPVGLAMRRSLGGPPTRWSTTPPAGRTGWSIKAPTMRRASAMKSDSLFRSAVDVLRYFHSNRHYVLLPFIVIVLSLGLVLFFVQSSALAPFIYTLF